MVVVAIPSHNLGRAQSHSFRASPPPPSPEDTTHQLSSPITFAHASKHSIDSGIAFPQPPTPISPPFSTIAMDAASPTNELREPANPFEHVQVEEPAELDYGQHDDHGEHGYEHEHEHEYEHEHESEQGHEHEHEYNEAGPSGSRSIPPPANPRRHRSGVLMSRVRANSGGATFKAAGLSMTASKSWGDLSVVGSSGGLLMSTGTGPVEPSEVEDEGQHRDTNPDALHREEKRVFSDPSRRASEVDDAIWDNSARFYHHLHSRPASRPPSQPASRPTSPHDSPRFHSRETSSSPAMSPIYVRRSLTNLTLPPNSVNQPPGGSGLSASYSPNHQFLQQHLPPAFPFAVSAHSSPEASLSAPSHPMVILTPTTAEWKELMGDGSSGQIEDAGGSGSSGGSSDGRRSSVGSVDDSDREVLTGIQLRLQGATPVSAMATSGRPPLRQAVSVDVLGKEAIHSPDPGSAVPGATPRQQSPVPDEYRQNLIAPTPVLSGDAKTPSPPRIDTKALPAYSPRSTVEELERQAERENTPDDSPARFESIGRRESLRAVRKPGEPPKLPRTKTKREMERERLFRDLDEELEADRESGSPVENKWGVQEIGKGGGLGSRSSSVGPITDGRPRHERPADMQKADSLPGHATAGAIRVEFPEQKTQSLPIAPKPIHLSPTLPLKPSPLNASPLNAASGLPTPSDESPGLEDLGQSALDLTHSRSPSAQAANLDTIRHYARSLASRPTSPETKDVPLPRASISRRRDTNRPSLVAGRVVQPFAIPPSTALPPGAHATEREGHTKKLSFSSFSPFRSPSFGANTLATPPPFGRFDSTFSVAPSTGAPSEVGTPTEESAGGVGGRGIDDYVILKEAGKGAYGLVMRAKVKGPKGEPVGDEVIIKYIVKARILADCWKKHKTLGPIPVEIHVMDQIRHLIYHAPKQPHPWDPSRSRSGSNDNDASPTPIGTPADAGATPKRLESIGAGQVAPLTPDSARSSPRSTSSTGLFSTTQKYIQGELKISPERGHPNICQLLDFFEDREFYYMVMPRFGTGLDLFDRVEASPNGLDPFDIRSLMGQLADAVRFLHTNGIVHRDIKDENVILDGSGRCQLIDFGSAAHWRPGKRWDTFSGTLHYASPEILRGEMYGGKEQDVYALGTVMYVLLVGETPFSDLPDEVLQGLHPGSSAFDALEARTGGEHKDEGRELDGGARLEDAADLVMRCLEMEAGDRPTADQICAHRFLRGEGGWTGHKGWGGLKTKNSRGDDKDKAVS